MSLSFGFFSLLVAEDTMLLIVT